LIRAVQDPRTALTEENWPDVEREILRQLNEPARSTAFEGDTEGGYVGQVWQRQRDLITKGPERANEGRASYDTHVNAWRVSGVVHNPNNPRQRVIIRSRDVIQRKKGLERYHAELVTETGVKVVRRTKRTVYKGNDYAALKKAALAAVNATFSPVFASAEQRGILFQRADENSLENEVGPVADYRGQHTAPDKDSGSPGHDLTGTYHSAGEMEARDTAARGELTEADRQQRRYLDQPIDQKGIKPEDAIVKMGDKTVAAMADAESQQVRELMERFQQELDREQLDAEQRGIYDVMIGDRSETEVRKSDLGTLRDYVLLERGGIKRGAKHILVKHYSGHAGPVTAQEIVDRGRVMRTGAIDRGASTDRQTVYSLQAEDGARLQVTVARNQDGAETVITFYSNRKGQSQGHRASLTDPSELRPELTQPGGDVKTERGEPMFQRGEAGGEQDAGGEDRRFVVEAKDGRLWIVDSETGKTHKPGNSIYSRQDTPKDRARLEEIAASLNRDLAESLAEKEGKRQGPVGSEQLSVVSDQLSGDRDQLSGDSSQGDGGDGGKPPGTVTFEQAEPGDEGAAAASEIRDALQNEPTIDPAWKRLVKGLRLMRDSAVDTLRRAGGHLTKLADAYAAYTDKIASRFATQMTRFQFLQRLPVKERKAVFAEFERWLRAREGAALKDESRRAAAREAHGDPVELRQTSRAATQQLIAAVEEMFAGTGAENQRLGVQVFDPSANNGRGAWRPIGNFGKDYWPRIVRKELRKVLESPRRYQAEYDQLVKEYAEFRGLSIADAKAALTTEWRLLSAHDYLANLEQARTGQGFPLEWYEHRFDELVPDFIGAWTERLSQIEAFGQAQYVPDKPFQPHGPPDSRNAFTDALAQTQDKLTAIYVQSMARQVYQVSFQTETQMWMNHFRAYTTATKLGNWWSSLRNTTTLGFNTMPDLGAKNTLSAMAEVLWNWRKLMDQAGQWGALRQDFVGSWVDAHDFSDRQRQVMDWALKIGGFTYTERFNRLVSMVAARNFARWGVKQITQNPKGPGAQLFRARLERWGVDAAQLAAEMESGKPMREFGSDSAMAKLARVAVNNTQFTYDLNQIPLWANSTPAKFIFQFQKFGIQQFRRMDKDVFTPAFQGVNVDGKKVHDFTPLLMSMALMVGSGAALLALRAALFDKRRKDASWVEIKNTADEDGLRAAELAAERL
jgi:hypothetical protein